MSIIEDLGLSEEQIEAIIAEDDNRRWWRERREQREGGRQRWLNPPAGANVVQAGGQKTHWPDCPVVASWIAWLLQPEPQGADSDPLSDYWLIEESWARWVQGDRPTCKRCLARHESAA